MDAVSDRDFVAEALFDLALVGTHLSRLGEEMVLWSTEEFGFLHLDDAYATGSSMLPQKKNADIAELARAKAGRLIGHLTGLLATMKGLPLSYNRDLQEDKEPLFDALEQVERSLAAMSGLIATANFDTQAMAKAADSPTSAAADLAEWLVQKGMPFRQAHELVGAVVRDSFERRVPLPELVAAHPALGSDAVALLEPGVPVSRRTSPGGAGPGPVASQIDRFAAVLRADADRFGATKGGGPGQHAARAGAHQHGSRGGGRETQGGRDQASRDQASRDQANRDQANRDQANRDQASRDQANRDQANRDQASRDQASRDQANPDPANTGGAAPPEVD